MEGVKNSCAWRMGGIEILKNGETMVKKHDGKSWIVDDLRDDLWGDIMIWDGNGWLS